MTMWKKPTAPAVAGCVLRLVGSANLTHLSCEILSGLEALQTLRHMHNPYCAEYLELEKSEDRLCAIADALENEIERRQKEGVLE